jgi:peptidoglycan-N-acetylglucosamine deacetylase
LAEHHSWAWQRRTLVAVAIAAASYTLGLLLPFKSANHQEATNNLSAKLSPGPLNAAQLDDRKVVLSETQVLDDLVASVARLEAQQKRLYNYAVPKQFQGKTIKNVSVPGNQKVIALTFDDGPWPKSTNDILYILQKENIKATFFLLGRNVQNFPDLTKQIVSHGHVLANHSWNHPYHQHSPAAAAREIDRTDDIIYKTTGVKSVMFRPPGGYLNNGLAAYAASKKDTIVMWSADSQDYRASSASQIQNVMRDASSGGIVLMHDGGGDRRRTVSALPVIIEKLKQQGYQFVTLPELMEIQAKAAQQQKQAKAKPSTSGQ